MAKDQPVKGTYYWSRSDRGEFYADITNVDVTGAETATFWGTTRNSSNTGWVPNGCDFKVDVIDGGSSGDGNDLYTFTWLSCYSAFRAYPVIGGNLTVHFGS